MMIIESLNRCTGPEGRSVKNRIRHALDLTKHTAFEQGDMCYLWHHPKLKLAVELRFRHQVGWKARCRALDSETVFTNQGPEKLAQEIKDWVDGQLKHKSADEIAPPSKGQTIWEIVTEMIEGEVHLWPRQRKTIWQSDNSKVDIYNDGYGHIILIAVNGKVTPSKPIAINRPGEAAWVWHLADNAKKNYETWAKNAR